MTLDDEGPRPPLVTWYVDDLVVGFDVANAHPLVVAYLLAELRGDARPGGHAVAAPADLPDVVDLTAGGDAARPQWPAGLPQGASVSPFAAWLGVTSPPLTAEAGAWRGLDGTSGCLGDESDATGLVEVD